MSKDFFKVKKGLNLDPTNPASIASPEIGDIIVDSSDNNKLKRYDGLTSSWKDVGSGAGGINYISNNSDFEGGTVGWATYADAAGLAPVDGTGGTANTTFTATAVSPLRGTKSGLITKSVAVSSPFRQGEGVSYNFTIDAADQAQILRISFDYSTSTNYADGNIRVYVYDVTNNRLIEVVDRDLLASTQGKFVGTFQTSPDSLSYRLIFHIADNLNLDYTVEIDNVIVGPQTIVKGAIVTDSKSTTLTSLITGITTNPTFGTLSQNELQYSRRGENLLLRGSLLQTTAGTAGSGNYVIDLPDGLVVDLTKVSSGGSGGMGTVGSCLVWDGVTYYTGIVTTYGGDPSQLGIWFGDETLSPTRWSSTNVPFSSTNLRISFSAEVPITGWSSNVVLSENAGNREIVAKYNIATTAIANTGTTIVNFSNRQYDTSASVTTGASWSFSCPESGYYDVGAKIRFSDSAAFTAGTRTALYVFVNGVQTSTLAFHEVESSDAASIFMSINGSSVLYLSKGDSVDFRAAQTTATASITLDGATTENYASIAKRSSPQTIAASEVVAARYTQSYGQIIPSSTNEIINYSTKVYDTHNAVTTGTGWRFTAPQSGYYRITASLLYAAGFSWAATNRCNLDIYARDGQTNVILDSSTINYIRLLAATTTNVGPSQGSSVELFLKKSDYIEAITQHNRGADTSVQPAATYNYINIVKISGTN